MDQPLPLASLRADSVLVACPDARPPAYQAVVGLARAERLDGFLTASYFGAPGRISFWGRRLAPRFASRAENVMMRRHHPEIPADRVRSAWSYDVALQVESRLKAERHRARCGLARW